MTIENEYSGSFTSMELFDAYEVQLTQGRTYIISWAFPMGEKCKLYILRAGGTMHFIFTPTVDAWYAIVLTNEEGGTGSYSISVKSDAFLENRPLQMTQKKNGTADPGIYYTDGTFAMKVSQDHYSFIGAKRLSGANWVRMDIFDNARYTGTRLAYTSLSYSTVRFVGFDGHFQSSNAIKYPKTKTDFNDVCEYIIEYEDGTAIQTMTIGSVYSDSFESMELFDVYEILLTKGKTYDIILTNSASTSYNLYLLDKLNNKDTNYIDSILVKGGTPGTIRYSPLEDGWYCILISKNDGMAGTYSLTVDEINNPNPPILSSGSVTPSSGDSSTAFLYTVTYTDLDNNAPQSIDTVIDGGSYSMVKQNQSDMDFTDGCVYSYSTTLIPGMAPHAYHFKASDGDHTTRLPTNEENYGPTVTVLVETLPPVAYAGNDITIFEGETVQLNGYGYDNDGTILIYEWDFDGDGSYDWNSTTSASTTHDYTKVGTYFTTLRVTDDNGATTTDMLIVNVKEKSTEYKETESPWLWLILFIIIILQAVMILDRVLFQRKKTQPPPQQDKTHDMKSENEQDLLPIDENIVLEYNQP
jgi:hypothetical protein